MRSILYSPPSATFTNAHVLSYYISYYIFSRLVKNIIAQTTILKRQIIKLFSPAYPHIQLRCIFRPVQILSSFFRFKDRIPLGLRSRVVYKFKCQC